MDALTGRLGSANESLSEMRSLIEIIRQEEAYERPETEESLRDPAKGDRGGVGEGEIGDGEQGDSELRELRAEDKPGNELNGVEEHGEADNCGEDATDISGTTDGVLVGTLLVVIVGWSDGSGPRMSGAGGVAIAIGVKVRYWVQRVKSRTPDWNWGRSAKELIHRYSGRKAANPYESVASWRQGELINSTMDLERSEEEELLLPIRWEIKDGFRGRAHITDRDKLGRRQAQERKRQAHARNRGRDDPTPHLLGQIEDDTGPFHKSAQTQPLHRHAVGSRTAKGRNLSQTMCVKNDDSGGTVDGTMVGEMNAVVGVASCISEITGITAPDAPYDDDKMKEVFHLMVSSFEDGSDTSSRSHRAVAAFLLLAVGLLWAHEPCAVYVTAGAKTSERMVFTGNGLDIDEYVRREWAYKFADSECIEVDDSSYKGSCVIVLEQVANATNEGVGDGSTCAAVLNLVILPVNAQFLDFNLGDKVVWKSGILLWAKLPMTQIKGLGPPLPRIILERRKAGGRHRQQRTVIKAYQ
ncbi:DNA ligase 1-like [Dorcoceras hygrometricum]|uniref:DNA ligase 1-like n=1 Tax=Dorcoceras hygrometricum TaxID=472368 RepID=A0A2Z7C9V3_9LAMI|nr:DNA ligase 1-like [Dorcoceras hygrometricum]